MISKKRPSRGHRDRVRRAARWARSFSFS